MDCVVGMECDIEVGIAKELGYFTYHGVVINKREACFWSGGVCKWSIVCG
jgi:hypothetical protein